MALEEWPTQAVVMMMMMMVRRKAQRRLLAIGQERGGTIDYLQFKTYIGIQHTTFFLFCFYGFYFLKQTFGFSLRQRILIRTSFYIYAFDWNLTLNL